MNKPGQALAELVARLRLTCLDLPEAYEEEAWAGTRWMVRKKNFAHVLMIADGWPPAYVKAAGTRGPARVLTFRSPRPQLDSPRFRRAPFFRPPWFPDIVGMVLDEAADWYEVGALVTRSYRLLAPAKLAALVEPPE